LLVARVFCCPAPLCFFFADLDGTSSSSLFCPKEIPPLLGQPFPGNARANRHFPPPWSVEEQPACFIVRDSRSRMFISRTSRADAGPLSCRSDDLAKCPLQDWPLGSPSA